MNKDFITTQELLTYLKQTPFLETESRLLLGCRIHSIHYWYWDADVHCLMHTHDGLYSPVSEDEVLAWYGNCKWRICL